MTGPVTRRELIHGLSGTGLIAAAGVIGTSIGTSACGGPAPRAGGPMGGTAADTTPADEGLPRRGGRIRAAGMSLSTADTLDPARGATGADYCRHYMLYSGLTTFDSNLIPQLRLAEELATEDRQRWHVRLRRGVRFHDGRLLGADDVAWSLLRHKDPATASKLKPVADQFTEIRSTGPLELEIVLDTANADLPAILADSHMLIVPQGTKDFSAGIGTGPFRLQEFKPGVRTVVVRNEEYWRDGRPYLDAVELIGIPDELARVNALLSGDVQIIIAVNPRSTRRIRESPGHRLQVTKSGLYTDLVVRLDTPRIGNTDFVLAMKHLFDRETILRALFRGYATAGNDHPIPPTHRYALAVLPQRPYDPERARFHLKKAGLLGLRLPVYASPAAEASVDMATMLQHSASQAGLTLAVNRVPADGYWSTHWMRHPLSFGNTNPRPTADLLFTTLFKSDAPWNESGWKNERFDELLVLARGEGDDARRREMYGEMQRLVHEHCGLVIPAFIDLIDGVDRRVKGYGSLPIGGLMGYQFAEQVWLDDGRAA